MRQRVPLFGPENKDRSPDVSSVERLNMYLGANPDQVRGDPILYSMPGTKTWSTTGAFPISAWRSIGNFLYVIGGNQVIRFTKDGAYSIRASIPLGTEIFDASDNGEEILMTTSGGALLYTIATDAVDAVADFPGGYTVTYQGGRFLSENGDKIWASAYGDGATWDGLTFASAEAYPDDIMRVFAYDNIIIVFGERSVEFWQNVGTTPFPYAPVGSAPQVGLAGRFSVAAGSDAVYALMRDPSGRLAVCKITNYAVSSITDPRQSALMESLSTVTDARGFVFEAAGHEFYQISFPTDGKTWIYDDEMGVWSTGVTIDGSELDGLRAISFHQKRLIASGIDGTLAEIDLDASTWMGKSTPKGFVSRNVSLNYQQAVCPSVELECEAGTGINGGPDPQIMMQISRDGGQSWGTERWRGLGKIGARRQRQIWWRNGASREWTFRFRISDEASRVVIMSALAEFQVGTA